jgi:hypothetical protein
VTVRDRFAQIRADRAHALELAHLANTCPYCGAVHPSIINHGPDGWERNPEWSPEAPARKRGARKRGRR